MQVDSDQQRRLCKTVRSLHHMVVNQKGLGVTKVVHLNQSKRYLHNKLSLKIRDNHNHHHPLVVDKFQTDMVRFHTPMRLVLQYNKSSSRGYLHRHRRVVVVVDRVVVDRVVVDSLH